MIIKVNDSEFASITKLIHQKSGIILDKTKKYLIESRLGPLLRELGVRNYQELYLKINRPGQEKLLTRVIDEISTNETSFFRDKKPFELLKFKLLPDIIDCFYKKPLLARKGIKIWSAASSTGQEVYSIAMIIKELFGSGKDKYIVKITGTDISDQAVVKASRGSYSSFEVGRGLDQTLIRKYFRKTGATFTVADELRGMAYFQKKNLLDSLVSLGKFDIIFCRNVAIYFNQADRTSLFNRLANQLNPDGSLIIGSTETLHGVSNRFQRQKYHQTVYYKLNK
jgi:chemotaxis protein methyltransferase CheR